MLIESEALRSLTACDGSWEDRYDAFSKLRSYFLTESPLSSAECNVLSDILKFPLIEGLKCRRSTLHKHVCETISHIASAMVGCLLYYLFVEVCI
jgi:hypothetical protein